MNHIKKATSILCSVALFAVVLLPTFSSAEFSANDVNPLHLGSISNGEDGARLSGASDVFVSGDYAYVTARTSDTLEVIDVSDPLYPVLVGSLADGDGGAVLDGAWSVVVEGSYAFVTAKDGDALQVIDVSDPANPTAVATLADGDGGAELNAPISIDIEGDYAYIASYVSDALEIVDISDPENPTHVTAFYDGQAGAMLDGASDVLVDSNYVYVTSQWSNALQIINISDPEYPTHVGSISHPIFLRQARSVAIRGSYAFITARSKLALQVIDISDRENPVFAGSLGNDNSGSGAKLNDPNSIIIKDDVAFITSYRSSAIEMVDVSEPESPSHIAHLTHGVGGANLQYPNAVFYSGGFLYATSAYEPGVLSVISPSPEPDIVVDPSDYDFGEMESGSTLTKTFRVTNTGYLDLEIGEFTLINDTDFSITENNCDNGSLDIREECTFDVLFQGEGLGLKTGVVGIMNNIEEKNPLIVELQGTLVEAQQEEEEEEEEEEEDDLEITVEDEGSLNISETSNMRLSVLGVSITWGSNGPNVPVKLETTVEGETQTIFSGTSPQVEPEDVMIIEDVPSDTSIHFEGTSYNPWYGTEYLSVSTEESSPMIIALKNGDSVPEMTPVGQQPNIDEFLSDYIDAEGNVTIGQRDVIYLFELGTGNPSSSSADFQDAVLLVTFE
jgi:hypothetical protein